MKSSHSHKSSLLLILASAMIISSAFFSPTYAADIYKTVDENGKVTYSDKITNDRSVKLETKELNTVPPVAPSAPKTKKLTPSTQYKVAITAPSNEFHVNPGQRDLSIAVSTVPNVSNRHRIQISDNGTPIEGKVIQNITRGTHVIIAVIIDERGKVIASSEPITVYVHRPNVN